MFVSKLVETGAEVAEVDCRKLIPPFTRVNETTKPFWAGIVPKTPNETAPNEPNPVSAVMLHRRELPVV